MCRHILNAQVNIQAGCCLRWYECSECHDESNDHQFKISDPVRLTCKHCKRAFQIDLRVMMESDKYCITPESKIFEDSMDYFKKRLDCALNADQFK
eukprot:gene2115-2309_t